MAAKGPKKPKLSSSTRKQLAADPWTAKQAKKSRKQALSAAKERAVRGSFEESKADGGWGADYHRRMRQADFLATPIVPAAIPSKRKKPKASPKVATPKPSATPKARSRVSPDTANAILGLPRTKKYEETVRKLTEGM
jgi:hypothetical protein